MKYPLIELIEQIELSFLLAVESMLPWESINPDGYFEGSLVVRVQDESFGRQIRALVAGNAEPVLFANQVSDRIEWVRGSGDWPQGLSPVIRALGGIDGARRSQGSVLLTLDSDTFDARLRAVDASHNLLRFLSNAEVPKDDAVKGAACISHWALQWHTLRCTILEKGDSEARSTQQQEWALQMQSTRFGLREHIAHVQPHFDPRGSAFELTSRCGERTCLVSPVRIDWEPGKSEPTKEGFAKRSASRSAQQVGAPKAVPVTQVDAHVLSALRLAEVRGNELFLAGTLSKKDYDKVNALLVSLGGRWDSGKRSHVFENNPASWLDDLLASGCIRTAKDYEFFPTPLSLVQRMLQGIPLSEGMLGLEPQAGDGAIAEVLAQRLGGKQNVTCYELWERNAHSLRSKGFSVQVADFLAVQPQALFDIAALNPPFSGGRDVLHVTHALKFVKPGGWLAAITSTSWQKQDSAANLRFRALLQQHAAVVDEVEPGAFAESGTDVPTLLVRLRVAINAPVTVAVKQNRTEPHDVPSRPFDLLAYL